VKWGRRNTRLGLLSAYQEWVVRLERDKLLGHSPNLSKVAADMAIVQSLWGSMKQFRLVNQYPFATDAQRRPSSARRNRIRSSPTIWGDITVTRTMRLTCRASRMAATVESLPPEKSSTHLSAERPFQIAHSKAPNFDSGPSPVGGEQARCFVARLGKTAASHPSVVLSASVSPGVVAAARAEPVPRLPPKF